MPGRTTVVVSICSTMAGPAMRLPGAQLLAVSRPAQDEAAGLGQPDIAFADDRARRHPALHRACDCNSALRTRAGGLQPQRDQLHRLALRDEAVDAAGAPRRSRRRSVAMRRRASTGPSGSGDGELVVLAGVAHVRRVRRHVPRRRRRCLLGRTRPRPASPARRRPPRHRRPMRGVASAAAASPRNRRADRSAAAPSRTGCRDCAAPARAACRAPAPAARHAAARRRRRPSACSRADRSRAAPRSPGSPAPCWR